MVNLQDMEENITNICRACLTDKGEFQSIFVRSEVIGLEVLHSAEIIMAYSSVQITFGDGLPEQICSSCVSKATEMYVFKKQCEESDMALRQRLGMSPLLKTHVENESPTDDFQVDGKVEVLIKSEMCCGFETSEEGKDSNEKYEYVTVLDKSIDLNDTIIYECCICSQQFNTVDEYSNHKKAHISKLYKCDLCPKVFARKDLLQNHTLTHLEKTESRLDTKGNAINTDLVPDVEHDEQLPATPTIDSINEDRKTHKRQKDKSDLDCHICNRKFTKSSHLTRHLKIHNPIKPHACKVCYKRYARREQLMTHMNIHMGVKPHVCEICFKGFNQMSNLKDHMRTHNGEKPFLCSTCGKGFNQLGNLRQHTVRHSGVKAHICTFCGNGFASKGELSAHVRKHTGARPFVCSVCNHGFTTSSSLTKHKRIHSGEKPYECDVCHMKFSRSGILARHKRTHTGEKPYICKFCTKAFSQSNDLNSHLRIHTGEKPFVCDICGSAFRQSSALKTHKKTHMDRNTIHESKVVMNIMPHTTFLANLS